MVDSGKRVVLGIDPGTLIMGLGIVEVVNSSCNILYAGTMKFNSKLDHAKRLELIFETVVNLIDTYNPVEMAIESPFYGKNVQSMLKLGRAQGVCMAAAMGKGLPVSEYSARRVKQAITGNGNATKEQVSAMIQSQYAFLFTSNKYDATDAVAIALCHIGSVGKIPSNKKVVKSTKKSTWKNFVESNPEKIYSK